MKPQIKLREFAVNEARPLPVILLLDASGSMAESGKMEALNRAVQEMLAVFADEPDVRAGIQVGAIAFGSDVRIHLPLLDAERAKVQWQSLQPRGNTPLGGTLALVHSMLEDKSLIPSRSYRPTLVLVSDGQPNDEWEGPLKLLLESPRASKAVRMAMAIGSDADAAMLQRFLSSSEARVFKGHEARDIHKFFKWVTMSVAARSRSATPDKVEPIDPLRLMISDIEQMRKIRSGPAEIFGAAVRGPLHVKEGRPCEDVWKRVASEDLAAMAISDGMGSRPLSAVGARAATGVAIRAARSWASNPAIALDWVCRLVEVQWRFALGAEEPQECAATCHLLAASREGGLVYVGLGDGMALLWAGEQQVENLSSRPGVDFVNETLALGVNHRLSDWVQVRLRLPESPWIAALVTDGVADDLHPDKLAEFLRWLRDDIGAMPASGRTVALRKALREWPTPGHLDDKTVAVMIGH